MKLKDVIDVVDDIRKNSYSVNAKIILVSDLDARVRDEVMKQYDFFEIMRVEDQESYDLPEGIGFESIDKVFLEGKELPRIDYRSFERAGYYLDSDGKLALYPVPTVTDADDASIRAVYKEKLARYTEDDYTNNVELVIPEPYSALYISWMLAKINYYDRQYDDYNNDITVFNSEYRQFAAWFMRSAPMDNQKIRNLW